MTREDVARLIRTLAVEIDDAESHRLKGVLQAAVEQITLDPANLYYRIATNRTLDMTFPRGKDVISSNRSQVHGYRRPPASTTWRNRIVAGLTLHNNR